MTNKYKEIIYLNTTELNSALSQLNQGLVESLVEKSQNSSSSSKSTKTSTKVGGGVKLFEASQNMGLDSSNSFNELFGSDKNIVLSDYKLNKLLEQADVKELGESVEGDFIKATSNFGINDYNFSSSVIGGKNDSTINSSLKNFMKDINAWGKETEQGFKFLNHYLQFSGSFSQGNPLIHMENLVAFAPKSNFRINSGELQTVSYSTRKITIFGIVEAVVNDDQNGISNEINELFSGNDAQMIEHLGLLVPLITKLVLSTSGLIKKGDKFVRPIALYFD